MIEKIISGGQTGADQGGWEAAELLGIPTGGWMPKGFRTETKPRPDFADRFNAQEMPTSSYSRRTHENVEGSDGTVIFGRTSGGTGVTLEICRHLEKPVIINPIYTQFEIWVKSNDIRVLNVAGNRESKFKGMQALVRTHLSTWLERMKNEQELT